MPSTELPDSFLRLPEVLNLTGVSRASLYRRVKRPLVGQPPFPAPIKLGRATVWSRAEIADWIDALKAARPAA